MSFSGIEFNNKHSFHDLNLTIVKREIGNPSKIKRLERVPFSNVNYDFSNLYGGQEFEERSLKYEFNIGVGTSPDVFYLYETEVTNWLMGISGKQVLKDDWIPGYYFLAELVANPANEHLFVGGKLVVEFTAYPFKIGNLYEGHDIWDDFNFLLDYAQEVKFDVAGNKAVTLYNPSATTIIPEIIASAPMEVIRGNTTYKIPIGTSKSHELMLLQNENRLIIRGNGTIDFKFRKELI